MAGRRGGGGGGAKCIIPLLKQFAAGARPRRAAAAAGLCSFSLSVLTHITLKKILVALAPPEGQPSASDFQ